MFVDGPNLSDRNPSPAPRLVQQGTAQAAQAIRLVCTSSAAKQSTPVPDLCPVVLWRLWGGELDEARTLQCLPGFSRRQPERLSGGHALDLWSLWGGKFNPEECVQLPLLLKGFGCGTACLPGMRLLSRGAARPRGRKRELLPRVLQALRRDPHLEDQSLPTRSPPILPVKAVLPGASRSPFTKSPEPG